MKREAQDLAKGFQRYIGWDCKIGISLIPHHLKIPFQKWR